MEHKIVIRDGKSKTYFHRKFLSANNCVFKKTGKYTGEWHLTTDSEKQYLYLDDYCKRNKLKLILKNDEKYSRSVDYRRKFFRHKKGLFNSEYYRCVYCGCIHKKDKITVDHLIPVYKVEQSSYRNIFRKLMSAMKFKDCSIEQQNL